MGRRESVRRKVLLDLLSDPLTLLPAAGGLTCLLVSWGFGLGGPMLLLLGSLGLLGGVGTYFTRLLLNSEELTRKAMEELEQESAQEKQAALDRLEKRLEQDEDPRTDQLLRKLRSVRETLEGNEMALDAQSRVEIQVKVRILFQGCLEALNRSLEYVEKARATHSDELKQAILSQREKDLEEVASSVATLERVAKAQVSKATTKQSTTDLAALRAELDHSLDVARKVDERMQALDQELTDRTRERHRS